MITKHKILLTLLTMLTISFPAYATHTPTKTSETASVVILEPKDGATVATTFTVKFGASGVDIMPAGTVHEHSGHHHLFIDTDVLPAMDSPLPASPTLIHFGKAQTETQLTLTPGKHTLQLVLGNAMHIPGANPVISKKITVTVK